MAWLLGMRQIKKREWITAAVAAFVLVVADCMFENRDGAFWENPVFWFFAGTAAAFFGAAFCLLIFDDPKISAVVAVCGSVVLGVLSRASAPLVFCVLIPAILLLFAQRPVPTNTDEKAGSPVLLLAADMIFVLYSVAAGVYLIRGLFFSDVPFQFFSRGYNDRLYGFWPLLLIFAGAVVLAVAAHSRVPEKTAAGTAGGKKEKQNAGNKKKNGARKSVFPQKRLLLFHDAVPCLFFVDAMLCYMLLQQTGERFLPFPLMINLSALWIILSFSDRLQRR